MTTDVEGGNDVVQMGDIFGMISGNVLKAEVNKTFTYEFLKNEHFCHFLTFSTKRKI